MKTYERTVVAAFLIVAVTALGACNDPCSDDIKKCSGGTLARFVGGSWESGEYIAHIAFPGFAAQCRFGVGVPADVGFSACTRDATYADYPNADPADATLSPTFDDAGIVTGIRLIDVDGILAQDYVHVAIERSGMTIFNVHARRPPSCAGARCLTLAA